MPLTRMRPAAGAEDHHVLAPDVAQQMRRMQAAGQGLGEHRVALGHAVGDAEQPGSLHAYVLRKRAVGADPQKAEPAAHVEAPAAAGLAASAGQAAVGGHAVAHRPARNARAQLRDHARKLVAQRQRCSSPGQAVRPRDRNEVRPLVFVAVGSADSGPVDPDLHISRLRNRLCDVLNPNVLVSVPYCRSHGAPPLQIRLYYP